MLLHLTHRLTLTCTWPALDVGAGLQQVRLVPC